MKLDSVRGYRIRCSKFLRYIILQGVLASPGAGRVPHAVWLKLSSKSVLLAISVRPMYILLRKLFINWILLLHWIQELHVIYLRTMQKYCVDLLKYYTASA
jgi:hypothetical protein